MDIATHVPVRDVETLESQLGVRGDELAEHLVRNASRAAAAVGAAAGALIGAEELSPPSWLVIPAELVVETLAIAAIEVKALAELQEVYGRPVRGPASERGVALARAWADRRGVRPADLLLGAGFTDLVGRQARLQLARTIRRRLVRRMGRNLAGLAPLVAGAVAGAELNRRATLAFADAVRRDLASRRD